MHSYTIVFWDLQTFVLTPVTHHHRRYDFSSIHMRQKLRSLRVTYNEHVLICLARFRQGNSGDDNLARQHRKQFLCRACVFINLQSFCPSAVAGSGRRMNNIQPSRCNVFDWSLSCPIGIVLPRVGHLVCSAMSFSIGKIQLFLSPQSPADWHRLSRCLLLIRLSQSLGLVVSHSLSPFL